MEAGLLGLLAGVLGLALGMALSLVLIYVVNKQSFGWTIQFHPPALLLAGALLLVWAVTVLAGVYPARFAAQAGTGRSRSRRINHIVRLLTRAFQQKQFVTEPRPS